MSEQIPFKKPNSHADAWASPVSQLKVSDLPAGAVNLNVEGRQLTGPIRGFGQLWQKTFWIPLTGVKATPVEVIQTWKTNFQKFWPEGNKFYNSAAGIAPGNVAVLNMSGAGGIKAPDGATLLSTGIMVIYADDESFSFMTPQGHMFAGMITFSAFDVAGSTVAHIRAIIRANDPFFEMTFRLGFGHKVENQFWRDTLQNLAAHYGVTGQAQQEIVCVDPKVQWGEARNIWHNSAIRTGAYMLLTPMRWVQGKFKRQVA
ncbi:MAG: hypothetical protein EHM70_14680 [Chloroflexota bacterium]|nr:MAG: hypothetical protein EHM70_14680 [Chloroflexota bacterium]